MRFLAFFLMLNVLGGCSYRDHLKRGQRLYQQNEFAHALAVWRTLEPDVQALDWQEQARYYYLRGMTAYRLGYKRDARHWLALAKAVEGQRPGGLQGDWSERTEVALNELNREVFRLAQAEPSAKSLPPVADVEEDLGRSSARPPRSKGGVTPQTCGTGANCSGDETCVSGKCGRN